MSSADRGVGGIPSAIPLQIRGETSSASAGIPPSFGANAHKSSGGSPTVSGEEGGGRLPTRVSAAGNARDRTTSAE